MRRPSPLALLLLVAVSCGGNPSPTPSPSTPPVTAPPPPTASGALCNHPPLPTPAPAVSPPKLPGSIAAVQSGVEDVRGLHFTKPVVPESVSQAKIGSLLDQALDRSYPPDMMARRGLAWRTIGVLPAGADLRQAIDAFAGSQIIGFYDTLTHQLVFSGSDSPTPYERVTLAHELIHALDDQHFDLRRLDQLEAACQDERLAAFVGLAEGDAVVNSFNWAEANLSAEEITRFQQEAADFPRPAASIPPFVVNLFQSPYPNGQAFVRSLLATGGEPAVNRAFENPPVSTEQILHPDRYPKDRPTPVSVPDLAEKLGGPWHDLDIYQVGELWLRLLLELRLPQADADAAAAGWDGGQYRAWTLDDQTAVLLQTVWDSGHEADQFAAAMRRWIHDAPAEVVQRGDFVEVLFGSDRQALRDLDSAT